MAIAKKDFRIIFMGTPDFAVASLEALLHNEFNVVAVVTAPDKPAGRGKNLQMSSVKVFALAHNIPVLQPEKLRDEMFLKTLISYNADLQVVVAFRMLPEIVWRMPKLGSINLHGSLLPDYRGAAPIQWAIINGEKITGVTTFFLQHDIDTGNIIGQKMIDILPEDNVGTLYDKMKILGATLLTETLEHILSGNYTEKPQKMLTEYHHAPKIFKKDMEIDFSRSAEEVHNLVRGLSPYPAAFTFLNGKQLKIYQTKIDMDTQSSNPIFTDHKTYLKFKCADAYIDVLSLQLEGKKRMDIEEFLRGIKIDF
jgi:methionyl-tRNA formyltransferase